MTIAHAHIQVLPYPAVPGAITLSHAQRLELRKLLAEPISYIPDDRFSDSDQMSLLMQQKVDLKSGVSLPGEKTEILFIQYHYTRYRICQIIRKLFDENLVDQALEGALSGYWQRQIRELLKLYHQQIVIRSKIVSGNMGLVLAMAKQGRYFGVEFTDLISEGSMALLRATDRFDYQRGFKFSTYACRAIIKSFSRAARRYYQYRRFFTSQLDSVLEKDNYLEQLRDNIHQDKVEEVRTLFQHNTAHLSQTEQCVVALRFSLNTQSSSPLTLKQIGQQLGLSKERIRQIQNRALAKLRAAVEARMTFD